MAGSKRKGSTDGEKALVIVESPAKARTIEKYLGEGFVVESSIGHIRDLPSTASEIPAQYKEEDWSRIGVNVEDEFKPIYIVPSKKKSQVTKLRQLLKQATQLYLATDEDREGEAIAWHLHEVLNPKVPVKRMVFDEITQTAIQNAIQNPRDIDAQLVEAQEARRILDRLYGYEVSPVLWRKIAPKLSAGRVQSVATRLIVDRERERMEFVAADYWDLESLLKTQSDQDVNMRLVELSDKPIASGKDFDPKTGKLKKESVVLLSGEKAAALVEEIKPATFTVSKVTEKPFRQKTHPPFITSSLQQEAARKLRYNVQLTMRLAQSLYENGYITYMRTDSTNLSQQAIEAARNQAAELYGQESIPDVPRVYKKKAKGAQEAHEAIRPSGATFRTPKEIKNEVSPDEFKLYDLIWKRTLACQMKDAEGLRTTVRVSAESATYGEAVFSTSGKVISFPGFLRAYVEGADDPKAELEDQEKILPKMSEGDTLTLQELQALSHTTQPPARFTEASLIREMEDRGIGRPSTYATIISTIQDRGYVWKKGGALVPTLTAFAVINLMEQHFPDLVDFQFTAKMESDLDQIATGSLPSKPWLKMFYFGHEPGDAGGNNGNGDPNDLIHVGLKRRIGSGWEEIDARAVSTIPLGNDDEGRPVAARIGRYGPYIQVGDSDLRANIPEDIPPDELNLDAAKEFLKQAAEGDKVLGVDPDSGKNVYLKSGRFGPYVQLGDPERTEKGTLKKGGKPKMASVWPGKEMEDVALDDALKYLSFPKSLGTHPGTSEEVTVQDGRFGPYVKMGTETRSLENHEQLATITLDEALKLLAEPKKSGRGRASPKVLKDLGKHPESGEPMSVKSGRFGPYVTDGVVNASLPKGLEPEALTPVRAVELIKAREERMRSQGKDPRAKKEKKTASRKKAAKKTKKKASKKRAKSTS